MQNFEKSKQQTKLTIEFFYLMKKASKIFAVTTWLVVNRLPTGNSKLTAAGGHGRLDHVRLHHQLMAAQL